MTSRCLFAFRVWEVPQPDGPDEAVNACWPPDVRNGKNTFDSMILQQLRQHLNFLSTNFGVTRKTKSYHELHHQLRRARCLYGRFQEYRCEPGQHCRAAHRWIGTTRHILVP